MARGVTVQQHRDIAGLALSYVARTRRQSDQLPDTFADTEVDYRDDNRHLWRFHELSDDEEHFDEARAAKPRPSRRPAAAPLPRVGLPQPDLPARLGQPVRAPAPQRQPGRHRPLLEKHAALAKQLKRLLDLLKPQDKVRIRFQEEGSELDLDVAMRSLIDFKGGASPTRAST
jgi:nitric oxide reductase NorD protein